MTSSNPAFSGDVFQQFETADHRSFTASTAMTVAGTVWKSLVLLTILTMTAAVSWSMVERGQMNPILLFGSAIGALVVGLITSFKPTTAPWTAPLYAALEGLFLGAISRFIETRFPGLPVQAVALTLGTTFCMLMVYATGLIKVTPRFAAGLCAAMGAVFLVYIASFILSFFGIAFLTVSDTSIGSIIFSFVVVGIAAFSLLLDFDQIEQGAAYSAPKYMEWYGAFALMVSLVWLYFEILKLLMKLQSRD